MYRRLDEEPLFSRYTAKIDNHAFRAEYARAVTGSLLSKSRSMGGWLSLITGDMIGNASIRCHYPWATTGIRWWWNII
ncbi:hypothetical protein [Phosphitispora sp. TUW77]|uniref:hypothetical protein n=1 Tax=Phosphitispora sp. TUW77 TaxID=3152361 RepID=UPI003AB8F027